MKIIDFFLGKVSRTTWSTKFIPEIDGLRFFAILPVVLHHVSGYFLGYGNFTGPTGDAQYYHDLIFDFGKFGVCLFFSISGFILALPFAKHYFLNGPKIHIKPYFLRRAFRLEPPYIINILACFLISLAVGKNLQDLIYPLLGHLSYSTHIFDTKTLNTVTWTLEIEIQYYILAPLFAQVFRVNQFPVRVLTVLALGFLINSCQTWLPNNSNLCSSIYFFFAGLLFADIYVSYGKRIKKKVIYDFLALGSLFSAYAATKHGNLGAHIIPLCMFIGLGSAFYGKYFPIVLSNKFLTAIGGMCYTIYLYHYLLISLVGRLTENWGSSLPYEIFLLLQFCLMSFTILTVCTILFIFIEKPFMKVTKTLRKSSPIHASPQKNDKAA